MKAESLVALLAENGMRVFTVKDAGKLMGKSPKYASLFLSRAKGVRRLERGKYYIDGTGIYEIASHVLSPSYLDLETAFRLHNLTTQIPNVITVASSRRHKAMRIGGYTIRFLSVERKRLFGYVTANGVVVASVEKAIIDSLYLGVGFGECMEAFGSALGRKKINIEALINLTIEMDSMALAARVGFLLKLFKFDARALKRYRPYNWTKLSAKADLKDAEWRVLYEKRWLAFPT